MKNNLHNAWTVFIAAAIWLCLGNSLRGGCFPAPIQAIQGGGTDTKVGFGFPCGTGCDKNYYLSRGATSYSKKIVDTYTAFPACGEEYCHAEETSKSSAATITYYRVKFDPGTCSKSYTIETIPAGTVYNNSYNAFDYSCPDCIIWDRSCWGEWVDGNYVDGSYVDEGDCDTCLLFDWVGFPCEWGSYNLSSHKEITSGEEGCQVTKVTDTYTYQDNYTRSVLTRESFPNSFYQDPYETSTMIGRAKQCADNQLKAKSLSNPADRGGGAACSISLNESQDEASISKAKWRLAISGATAGEKYKITLHWEIKETFNDGSEKTDNRSEPRKATAPDALIWYYPGEGGEELSPTKDPICGYSYTKTLVDADVAPAN